MNGAPETIPPASRRWRRLRARAIGLSGGPLRRGVLLLAGGTAAAQAIVALASPIVTRLFTPAQFGASAAAIAVVGLVLAVTCLTYDHAVPLPKDDDVAADLLVLSGLASIVMSAVFGLVLTVDGGQILGLVDASSLTPYVWLLVLGQLAAGFLLALTGWAIRGREFGGIASSRISQSVAMVGTQIGAGLGGLGAVGLLLGDTVGKVASAATLFRRTRPPGLRRRTRQGLGSSARRYRRFPLVGSWPSLINAVALEIPLLLLAAFFGARVGGLFAFAQRLIVAPVALVTLSISQAFVAEAARHAREDPAALRPLFVASFRKLLLIGVPFLAAIAAAGSVLVAPVFGDEWHEAGVYLAILTPLYLTQLVTSPFGGVLDVLERQELLLVREVVRGTLLAGAVLGARALGFSATGAVVCISIAGTLAYTFYGLVSWHALRAV